MITKSKITDTLKNEKDFKYKKFKHDPNNLECTHCQYEQREQSLKDNIKDSKDTDKLSDGRQFKTMKVIRGRYDDVVGWVKKWQ